MTSFQCYDIVKTSNERSSSDLLSCPNAFNVGGNMSRWYLGTSKRVSPIVNVENPLTGTVWNKFFCFSNETDVNVIDNRNWTQLLYLETYHVKKLSPMTNNDFLKASHELQLFFIIVFLRQWYAAIWLGFALQRCKTQLSKIFPHTGINSFVKRCSRKRRF